MKRFEPYIATVRSFDGRRQERQDFTYKNRWTDEAIGEQADKGKYLVVRDKRLSANQVIERALSLYEDVSRPEEIAGFIKCELRDHGYLPNDS